MKISVSVDFAFSAAHALPFYEGVCKRMHGHNYRLQVGLSGAVSPRDGMVRDFEDIKRLVWDAALVQVDHHTLNDVHPNPTAENMAAWFWERLAPVIEGLTEVRLWENPSYCVTVTAS
jgi:6-pyruvoyltetrahydropterin/6-carboxytetrahydropterin synthase